MHANRVSQAERMVKRSRVDFKPGKAGDNVAVLISLVDRGRSDPQNNLGMMVPQGSGHRQLQDCISGWGLEWWVL